MKLMEKTRIIVDVMRITTKTTTTIQMNITVCVPL